MKNYFLFVCFIAIIPFSSFATIIIVDQNGSGDYSKIQEAIENAVSGDTVLVYPGTYIEVIDFLGKDIVVGSLFLTTQDTTNISQTVIDGNYENCKLVKFSNGESNNAKLIGFTITHASFPINEPMEWSAYGLGIYVSGSSPYIAYNRIIDNDYGIDENIPGGGIAIENSSAKIIGNHIENNNLALHGGGILLKTCSNVVIEDNLIVDNMLFSGYAVSYGAGIFIDSSESIIVRNNVLRGNHFSGYGFGGGICIRSGENIQIRNNLIFDNGGYSARNGGGICIIMGEEVSIIGNLIYNNRARNTGAGIHCENSDPQIINNTICYNEVIGDYGLGTGGGLYCIASNPLVQNNIMYYNTALDAANQVFLDVDSDPDFYYSDIEGGESAFDLDELAVFEGAYEMNIDEDPLFLNSGDNPFQLGVDSKCINAGSPDTTGLFIGQYDISGNNRIIGDTIDMGAYECPNPTNIFSRDDLNEINIYPTPALDVVSIEGLDQLNDDVRVHFFDIDGRVVLEINAKTDIHNIDISQLPGGIYILRFSYGALDHYKKLVVL